MHGIIRCLNFRLLWVVIALSLIYISIGPLFQAVPAAHADLYGSQAGLFTLPSQADSRVELGLAIGRTENGSQVTLAPQTGLSAVAVNGRVELYGEDAFARIILVDAAGEEKLIFETNALLLDGASIELDGVCEETGNLTNGSAVALSIESHNASLAIDEILYLFSQPGIYQAKGQTSARHHQVGAKIAQIKRSLARKGKHWIAGETSISSLSYSEKKALFGGRLPNLYGFEYYTGGIFEIPSSGDQSPTENFGASPYVSEFSWRNRHGENWVTPVKHQGSCGSCWAFATTAAVELLVNLYYNQHLNLNLSEQEVLSCSNGGNCQGGSPGTALNYYISTGVSEEGCFPYTGKDDPCSDKCSNQQENILIDHRDRFGGNSEDELKGMLLQGPVSIALQSWYHAIGLVGYKTLQAGDRIYIETDTESREVTLEADDPLIGRTAWTIKNSWGTGWGQSGFAHVVTDLSNISATYGVFGPVESLGYSDDDVICEDGDNDGYCWWGLGDKPANCPPCAAQPDGDDSNARLGPMDEYGHLEVLSDTIAITSPGDDEIISDQVNIPITVATNVAGSQIIRVEFYAGTDNIGNATTEPYDFTWTNAPHGAHDLTAKMITDSGDIDSDPVPIIVCGELGEGVISRYVWTEISGSSVDNLKDDLDFPDKPDIWDERDLFEAPTNWGDRYGTRMAGYLHPPVTGTYRFWIAGNNQGELWLSSDDTPGQGQQIAEVPEFTNSREFDKYSAQQSQEITLEEGRRYFIEALHKENTDSDNLAVAWQIPGRDLAVIQGRFLSSYLKEEDQIHTVRFVAGTGGAITGVTEQQVKHGQNCSPVGVTLEPGYHFDGWTGDYQGNETNLTIRNVTSDMTVNASFVRNVYTVTFIAGANGAINGDLVQQVAHGDDCGQVTVTPATGFHFSGWTGDHTGNQAALTILNVTADMTIEAGFERNVYTVTFTAGANGGISGQLVQQVAHGANCTQVTAIPVTGFHFSGWTGDYTGNQAALTILNVTQDMTIEAGFDRNVYTVTFVTGANGAINGDLVQQVAHGSNCSPVSVSPDAGYRFNGWTGDHMSYEETLTIRNVTQDMTMRANFVDVSVPLYTVRFEVRGDGSISGDLVQQISLGSDCTMVTAKADNGCHFVGWTGDHQGSDEELTIGNVTADMVITAEFDRNTYTVSFASGDHGDITGEKVQQVAHGESSSPVSVTPDAGYHFSGWDGDHQGNGTTLTLQNVTGDMNVTAAFEINTYTITFLTGENGRIEGQTVQQVQHGDSASQVTAVPDEGYRFDGWTGGHEGTAADLTLDNVTADMTIQSHFEKETVANPGTDPDGGGGGGGGGGGCFVGALH